MDHPSREELIIINRELRREVRRLSNANAQMHVSMLQLASDVDSTRNDVVHFLNSIKFPNQKLNSAHRSNNNGK